MHAIEHPHLSRSGLMALGAVILAILVLLVAAARVGGIGANSRADTGGPAVGPRTTAHSSWSPAASWYANAFASPFHVVLPWARATGR